MARFERNLLSVNIHSKSYKVMSPCGVLGGHTYNMHMHKGQSTTHLKTPEKYDEIP